MEICTIGFVKKTAKQFFETLRRENIEQLVDVRIHNSSQLAGFTKSADLTFFLRELCSAEYRHEVLLAPTAQLLKEYRSKNIDWPQYEQLFMNLMRERQIESKLNPAMFERRTVLLCTEATATRCHRRLVAEYLSQFWPDLAVKHL